MFTQEWYESVYCILFLSNNYLVEFNHTRNMWPKKTNPRKHSRAKEKLLKLSVINFYVNVVNTGQNAETQDKCTARKATEVSTNYQNKLCICRSDEKSIREYQKANKIYFGPCQSVQHRTKMFWTDSVPLIPVYTRFRQVCAKVPKNKDRWLFNGPWTFRPDVIVTIIRIESFFFWRGMIQD